MGVSELVSAMGIEFTACVTALDANLGKVAHTRDLNIVGCPQKVCRLEGAFGHHASAATGSRAVGDDNLLNVSDRAVGFGRSPDAKIAGCRVGAHT